MATYSAGSAAVDITVNFTGFVEDLRARLDAVDASLDVRLGIDDADFRAHLDELTRTRSMRIGADLDDAAARARLDELTRDRTVVIRVNQIGGLNDVRGQADNASRSLNAMGAIKFSALAAGITALVPVIGGVIGIAGAAAGVFGGLAATIGLGSGGLIDAFKAMGQEAKAGSQAAIDAAQAQKDAINTVTDAQNNLLDSQKAQQDSLQAITDAQTNLTNARQEAKDAIDNLNLSEKQGELAARGASLSYAEASANLQKTIRDQSLGKASQLDVQRAQLTVDSSSQAITDVNVRNQQNSQKAQQANAQGVDNSPAVLTAQKALVDAQFRALDAQHATTDAVNALAKSQAAAAKAIADGNGGVNAFNEALKKLSPNAQEFVVAMQGLGPAFKSVREVISNNLFAGLGDTVSKFFNDQKNGITDTLGGIATAINGAIKQTFGLFDDLFTKLTADGTMKKFVDSISQALQNVGPGLVAMTDAVIKFTNAAAPSMGRLFEALGKLLDQVAGPLGTLGAQLADALVLLAPHLGDFINALANALGPMLPELATLFTHLLDELTKLVQDPAFGDLLVDLGKFLDGLIPIIEPLGNLVFKLLDGLLKIINGLNGDGGSKGIGLLVALINAIAGAFQVLADALSPIVALLNKIPGVHIGGGGHTIVGNAVPVPGTPTPSPGQTHGRGGGGVFGGFSAGGRVISGPGTGTSDSILGLDVNGVPTARVSNGEYVSDADTTDKWLPLLQALPGLADGGLVGSQPGVAVQNASQWAKSKVGIPYVLGGLDCSMFASGAYQVLTGGNPDARAFDTTKFATPSSAAAMGFVPGISGAFSVGVTPLPGADGHMAFTLGGVNGESGGAHNNVAFGPGAAGASDPQFSVQYSLPGTLFKPADASAGVGAAGTGTYTGPGGTSSLTVSPQAALPGRISDDQLTIQSDKSAVDEANAERNQIYADPSSTAGAKQGADIKYQQAQNSLEAAQKKGGLPEEYSLPGIASKGAGILVSGLLDSLGLGNSILSGSNPYNQALTTTANFYAPNGQLGGGYAYQPQNPAVVTTTTSPQLNSGATVAPPVAPTITAPAAPAAPAVTIAPPGSSATNPPPPHAYQPGGGAAQWKDTFVNVLYELGLNEDWADPGIAQMDTESGGDPNAINLWDSNAQKGTPSKGLMQVIDPTFDKYHSSKFPGDIWDPEANIAASTLYTRSAYGDPASIWGQGHGYDQGGVADGLGFLLKQTIRPERVLSPDQTETFDSALPLLESINSGRWSPNLPQGLGTQQESSRGGHDFSTHIHEPRVASVDDLADLVERDNFRRSIGFSAAL